MANLIRNKYGDPLLNEFNANDLVVNVVDGNLFFRSNTHLFQVEARVSGSVTGAPITAATTTGNSNNVATFSTNNSIKGEEFLNFDTTNGFTVGDFGNNQSVRLSRFGGHVTMSGNLIMSQGDINGVKNISASNDITASGLMLGDNGLHFAGLNGLSAQNSEDTTLMVDGTGKVGTRNLGTNAFTSTQIGNTQQDLSVDDVTLQFNSGTTFDGAVARTISIKDGGVDSDALAANIAVTELTTTHITTSSNISASGVISANEFRCTNQLTVTPDTTTFTNIDSTTPRIRLHSIANLGVLDFSNSDDVFVIRPDSTEKIRIRGDGKTSFHNDVAIDTSDEPTISLAIGHADTGFNSLATDDFRVEANGQDTMRFKGGGATANDNTTTGGGVYIENIASHTGATTVKIDTSTGKVFYKQGSTRQIKKNIINISDKTIDLISKIRPVKYKYKSSNELRVGFIAEELADAHPLFAVWGADFKYDEKGQPIKKENQEWDLKSNKKVPIDINYDAIVTALVGKVQQLEKRINELEKK